MLPTFGPHFSQAIDAGNLYTRELAEEYVSAAVEVPAGKNLAKVDWNADAAHGAKVRFQIRLAASQGSLQNTSWRGPGGENTYFETSGTELSSASGERWVQYRAVFESPDGGAWPILNEVSLVFR